MKISADVEFLRICDFLGGQHWRIKNVKIFWTNVILVILVRWSLSKSLIVENERVDFRREQAQNCNIEENAFILVELSGIQFALRVSLNRRIGDTDS